MYSVSTAASWCAVRPGTGCVSTRSQIASSGRGTPARTWRGRSGPCPSRGAAGTAELDAPGQCPTSAAYSSPTRSNRSAGDVVGVRVVAVAQVVAAQPGVDREADQLDRAGLGDHDVLGQQPPVRDALPVGHGDRRGHLAHQPGGAVGRQHPTAGDISSREWPEPHSLITHAMPSRRSASSTRSRCGSVTVAEVRAALEHRVDARVALVEDVHRDAAGQHRVGGPPEAGAVDVVEQVVEAVPTAEQGARDHRAGHVPPSRRGSVVELCTMLPAHRRSSAAPTCPSPAGEAARDQCHHVVDLRDPQQPRQHREHHEVDQARGGEREQRDRLAVTLEERVHARARPPRRPRRRPPRPAAGGPRSAAACAPRARPPAG